MTTIQSLFQSQTRRRWQQSQTTARERIEKLRRLKTCIQAHESELKAAMWADFRKPAAEVELTEIFPVIQEIKVIIRSLRRWMKPKRVMTPLVLFGNRSEIHHEARGLVLVIAPWNYPFLLLMTPLASAIAAGNCVIGKPSEKTPQTSALIEKIISEVFSPDEAAIVQGGVETSQTLMALPFDHIFFTGSTRVGQIAMQAAAKHLSSVTLELGGKSPTIVLPDANIKDAVDKIAWGRYLNGGQSCVAPDHVYVPESRREDFSRLLKERAQIGHGKENMTRIIDQSAFDRLLSLLKDSHAQRENIIVGGEIDLKDRYISATAIEAAGPSSPLMREEIFGPILPVLYYKDLDALLASLQTQPKPLALYIFGKKDAQKVLRQTSSGGAMINNVVIHFANHSVPLGGVGASGQGHYHGYEGFRTLSHQKAVMKQSPVGLSTLLHPPYDRRAVRLGLWICKLFSK